MKRGWYKSFLIMVCLIMMVHSNCMEEREDGSKTAQVRPINSLAELALIEIILDQVKQLNREEEAAGQEMLMMTHRKMKNKIPDKFLSKFLPEVGRTYYFLFNKYFDVGCDYSFSLGELIEYRRVPNIFRTIRQGTRNFTNSLVISQNYRISSLKGLDNFPFKHAITNCTIENNLLPTLPLFISLMPNLVQLDLRYNKIERIEDNALQGLSELRTLILAYNKLSRLSDKTFVGGQKLTILNLNNNRIDVIEAGTFTHLARLNILNLYSNQLSVVPRELLRLTQLTVLTLGKNSIPENARSDLEQALSNTTIDWNTRSKTRSRTYIGASHDNAT